MAKILIITLFTLFSAYGQNTTLVRYTNKNRIFEISIADTQYSRQGKISIPLVIINNSKEKFFINDPDFYNFRAQIYQNAVYFQYGSYFDAEFGTFQKLKVVNPGDSLTIDLNVDLAKFRITEKVYYLYFYVDIGIFDYDKGLLYLTKGENKRVPFKKYDADAAILFDLFHYISVAYLHITLTR